MTTVRSQSRGAWTKAKDAYLLAHPTCEEPGCNQPAVGVSHKHGTDLRTGRFTIELMVAGCSSHHQQRVKERRAEATRAHHQRKARQ